jgi:hypothetical protein
MARRRWPRFCASPAHHAFEARILLDEHDLLVGQQRLLLEHFVCESERP